MHTLVCIISLFKNIINNAIQGVKEITNKNKRSIENLAQEVSKFKI